MYNVWQKDTVTKQHIQNPDQDAKEVEAPRSQQRYEALKEAGLQKTEIYEYHDEKNRTLCLLLVIGVRFLG